MARIRVEMMNPKRATFSHVERASFERYIAKGIETKRKTNWRITIESADPRVSIA
jgi:hypothetical protein